MNPTLTHVYLSGDFCTDLGRRLHLEVLASRERFADLLECTGPCADDYREGRTNLLETVKSLVPDDFAKVLSFFLQDESGSFVFLGEEWVPRHSDINKIVNEGRTWNVNHNPCTGVKSPCHYC